MKRPVISFVLAMASVVLSPVLAFIETSALFFAAMVTYEPANPLWVKVLSVAVVLFIGLLAFTVPVIALIVGTKARATARSTQTGGAGLATAAVVIAGIVAAGVVVAQVYLILMATGACSLDGC